MRRTNCPVKEGEWVGVQGKAEPEPLRVRWEKRSVEQGAHLRTE
jgi:hypothetical protein